MKIVFMGTPAFAADILKALVDAGHEITGVYTQPDKPKGRSGALIASEVKELAVSLGLTVYQPDRIKKPENVALLKTIPADVFVVAAFGQILSEEILNLPKFGCINVHGSLLPKYRGAAPIQRSIADGEEKTGVSIMQMDKGIDTGAVFSKVEFPILSSDNEDSIYSKMAEYGSGELIKVLKDIENGTAVSTPQDESLATYAPMLSKEEGLVDFNKSAWSIDCMIRGFQNWPTAYTHVNGKMLKIYSGRSVSKESVSCDNTLIPGTLIVHKKNIYVVTGEDLLELLEVQPEGKKRMGACDFARGLHLTTGDKLGV